ncbi:hypothetical protein J421_4405 [Gemmatirosa kalamazoonensis]|uniref:Type II secretion system protein GspC N-terminal domain-containing protein n=1 Tax=Gemmatirosa kalamazoonensis TaxID=861299 RepID=W0RN64_9BACT|nr:hypothetical protein [Gemmatirosa kalamazoonensis]AHG91942.1 hypothetical protein J421_4405 [Gemmatirosa kalamazoonensis]
MRVRRVDRVADVLWAGAALFGAVAAAALAWPASGRVPELPAVAALAAPRAAPAVPPTSDAVVRADVFAIGHAPPRARWAPPPVDTLPPGLAPDPSAASEVETPVVEPPRFYGTVTDAAGPAALLRPPGAAESRLFRAGDLAGRWRVRRVLPDRVTLASPDGAPVTLRLPARGRAQSPDSTP